VPTTNNQPEGKLATHSLGREKRARLDTISNKEEWRKRKENPNSGSERNAQKLFDEIPKLNLSFQSIVNFGKRLLNQSDPNQTEHNSENKLDTEKEKPKPSYAEKLTNNNGKGAGMRPLGKKFGDKDHSVINKEANSIAVDQRAHKEYIHSVFCLLGRFIGKVSSLDWVQSEMRKAWSVEVTAVPLARGYLQLMFNSKEDRERVFINGSRW